MAGVGPRPLHPGRAVRDGMRSDEPRRSTQVPGDGAPVYGAGGRRPATATGRTGRSRPACLTDLQREAAETPR